MALENLWDFLNGLDRNGTYLIRVRTPQHGIVEQLIDQYGYNDAEQILRFTLRRAADMPQVYLRIMNEPRYELLSVKWFGRNEMFSLDVNMEYREVNVWIESLNFQNEITYLLENSGYRVRMRRN